MIPAMAPFWKAFAICFVLWSTYAWAFLGFRTMLFTSGAGLITAVLILFGTSFLRVP